MKKSGFKAFIKNTQKDRADRANKFIAAYKELCQKHNLQLDAYFNYYPSGQVANLDVKFLELPQEYKDNPDLIQQNKEKLQEVVKPFLDEYEQLKSEHMLELHATCEITDAGIFPKVNIREKQTEGFQIKDWDEAKKENEKNRKNNDSNNS